MKVSKRQKRIVGLLAVLALGAWLLGRPVLHLFLATQQDVDERQPLLPGHIDDASRLNETKVAEVWQVPADFELAEKELAALLRRARAERIAVSIAGARHSMGGHTFTANGLVIDMLPFHRMELDEQRNILHVQAGARWAEIIPFLNARGRSVAVMQSNNSFSVGGSISVNCHGWQFDRPPIASTVESLRLMQADGTIVRCSRSENQELFSLVLGGYGLFGVILDVDLQAVANERYRLEQFIVPVDKSLETYRRQITQQTDVRMVYARLNVVPDRLLMDVILNVFSADNSGPIPELSQRELANLHRAIFRGSARNDYGKEVRWSAETKLQPFLTQRPFSRNQLLNESADVFQNRSATSTDILHEYFVPQTTVDRFVIDMRRILREHHPGLLNVTVREINTDNDSFLRYADQNMFSFVMLFVQERTPAGESRMAALTRELIDAAHQAGGRYYLPYRLHATLEQFHRAYPQAEQFFELKRKYDPDELFQNEFYRKYGGGRPSQ